MATNLPHEEGYYHHPESALRAKEDLLTGVALTALERLFRGLGNKTRLQIVAVLSNNELCVHDIATLLGMSQSAVSHQLKELRLREWVKTRREDNKVFYSLAEDCIRDIFCIGVKHIHHNGDEPGK
jgi:DNA-binding transcriptional ArsR family regulator